MRQDSGTFQGCSRNFLTSTLLTFVGEYPSCPQGNFGQTFMGIAWCKEVHFFGLCMLWESEKKNALANIYKFMK